MAPMTSDQAGDPARATVQFAIREDALAGLAIGKKHKSRNLRLSAA